VSVYQYVVVDSNEWIATKWFSTPIGKTFCDLVSDSAMMLAIPEVLGSEITKHRTRILSDLLAKARGL
jgi:hypothetical protein